MTVTKLYSKHRFNTKMHLVQMSDKNGKCNLLIFLLVACDFKQFYVLKNVRKGKYHIP